MTSAPAVAFALALVLATFAAPASADVFRQGTWPSDNGPYTPQRYCTAVFTTQTRYDCVHSNFTLDRVTYFRARIVGAAHVTTVLEYEHAPNKWTVIGNWQCSKSCYLPMYDNQPHTHEKTRFRAIIDGTPNAVVEVHLEISGPVFLP